MSAIGCHTTLKTDASLLDKVVFLADKIRWDQAVFCYLDYLWQQRVTLRVVHPWLAAAHQQLQEQLSL